jgi:hypothetical protein
MRTVVSKSEVAHFWANKTQSEARVSGGNFYFNAETIYSYGRHFPIATHYKDVVLMTTRTYSNTTAKHLIEVRRAISHMEVIYCTNVLEAKEGYHDSNIKNWLSNIQSIVAQLAKARKPEIYLSQIGAEKNEMQKYLDFFKVKLTKAQSTLISFLTSEEFKEQIKKAAALEKKANAAKLKLGEKVYRSKNVAWHEFMEQDFAKDITDKEREAANYYFQNVEGYNGEVTMLRTDGKEVQTSKGIKMKVEVAERYYRFYQRIVAKGGCEGDCNYKMLEYDVREANADRLVVGCHTIPATEINAIAAELGWK